MRSSKRTRALLAVGLLALALASAAPSPAHATEEDARTFFAQGRQLRAEGRCADAIVAFRRALDLFPHGLGALRNIAECEEQLGQYASARNDWWSLRRAVLQSNEPKYEGWDKDAEVAYARLEGKVARITVQLRGASTERAHVSIDGKPLDPRLVGVELERDLGPHMVEVAYGGAAPVGKRIELTSGEREVVTLDIPKPSPIGPTVAPVEAPQDTSAEKMRVAGIVGLSVGGVGMVGAVVSTLVRSSALSSITEVCKSLKNCPASVEEDEQRGRTASTLVNVFGAVALVGVGVGVPLFVLGGKQSGAQQGAAGPKAAWRVDVAPLPGGAAAQVGGRF